MDYLRLLAGGFVGTGALILIWQGEYIAGVALLGTMLGFFVGEKNGQRTLKESSSSSA